MVCSQSCQSLVEVIGLIAASKNDRLRMKTLNVREQRLLPTSSSRTQELYDERSHRGLLSFWEFSPDSFRKQGFLIYLLA